jgi:hypothetical protein
LVVLQQTVPQDEAQAVQRVVFLFDQPVVQNDELFLLDDEDGVVDEMVEFDAVCIVMPGEKALKESLPSVFLEGQFVLLLEVDLDGGIEALGKYLLDEGAHQLLGRVAGMQL